MQKGLKILTVPANNVHDFASCSMLTHSLDKQIDVALEKRFLLPKRLFTKQVRKVTTLARVGFFVSAEHRPYASNGFGTICTQAFLSAILLLISTNHTADMLLTTTRDLSGTFLYPCTCPCGSHKYQTMQCLLK